MSLTSGQVLNQRYRVVKLLASGGFGTVYRAWDLVLTRPCAIKENVNQTPDLERQFLREATLLANLSHSGLPHISDYFIIPDQGQYLVMEYIEGEDLQSILDRQAAPFSELQVLDWGKQVCEALIYLHKQSPPVIHRDIKPANMRLTSSGRVVLVDFGIAKMFDPHHRTTQGARAVSAGYSPPEQYGQGVTDTVSDVYALGATLYALLTGITPAESILIISKMAPIPQPVHELNSQVSIQVSNAIARAMQIQREKRFQSVQEFMGALLSAPSPVFVKTTTNLAHRTSQKTAPSQVTVKNPPKSKPQAISWIIGGGISLMLLLFICSVGYVMQWFTPLAIGKMISETPTRDLIQETTALVVTEKISSTAFVDETMTPWPTNTPVDTAVPPSTTAVILPPTPSETDSDIPGVYIDEFGILMAYVAAGSFQMGEEVSVAIAECKKLCQGQACDCSTYSFGNESPKHTVTLNAFYIDINEVTNANYAECVQAGKCQPPAQVSSANRVSYYRNAQYNNYPVVQVSWTMALSYCTWRKGRLPTEAEWEKAARGDTDDRYYPWGYSFNGNQYANICDRNCNALLKSENIDDGHSDTAPVGSFSAGVSPYGLFDMAGNVAEWVMDWYGSTYYQNSPLHNPLGPSSGKNRVVRGGSWYQSADYARVSNRLRVSPDETQNIIGIRCVRDP